jgi:hypothetical protein
MTSSSKRRAATRATRARQETTGETYNGARRQAAEPSTAKVPEAHPFKHGHWMRERCAEWRCNLDRDHPVHQIGGMTPPDGWPAWTYGKPMLSTTHDGQTRTVAVLDGQGDTVLASITAPWRPAEELLAEYEAESLLRPSTMDHREIELGRPDLLAQELGYRDHGGWSEWPDGSWRSPAFELDRQHIATIRPLSPDSPDLQVLTVREVPGGRIVVDELIDPIDPADVGDTDERLHAALNRHGYTVSRWGWKKLPGRVRYGLGRPGHRAERSWWTRAKVRILRDHTAGCPDLQTPDHTYRTGDVVTMIQYGSARDEIDRDTWWSSTDIDSSYAVRADNTEVLEVLEHVEPFWRDATLTVEQVTEALALFHGNAAEAAAAWARAGLVAAHTAHALVVYTSAPAYTPIGQVPRDYWDGNRLSKPYEVIVNKDQGWLNKRLDTLPLDPRAAAR